MSTQKGHKTISGVFLYSTTWLEFNNDELLCFMNPLVCMGQFSAMVSWLIFLLSLWYLLSSIQFCAVNWRAEGNDLVNSGISWLSGAIQQSTTYTLQLTKLAVLFTISYNYRSATMPCPHQHRTTRRQYQWGGSHLPHDTTDTLMWCLRAMAPAATHSSNPQRKSYKSENKASVRACLPNQIQQRLHLQQI